MKAFILASFVRLLHATLRVKHVGKEKIDALSQFLNWRTEAEARVEFSCDWGDDHGSGGEGGTTGLRAPSPEETLWFLRR